MVLAPTGNSSYVGGGGIDWGTSLATGLNVNGSRSGASGLCWYDSCSAGFNWSPTGSGSGASGLNRSGSPSAGFNWPSWLFLFQNLLLIHLVCVDLLQLYLHLADVLWFPLVNLDTVF